MSKIKPSNKKTSSLLKQEPQVTTDISVPINNVKLAEQFYEDERLEANDPQQFYVGDQEFIIPIIEKPFAVIDQFFDQPLFFTEKKSNKKLLNRAKDFLYENPNLQQELLKRFTITIEPQSLNRKFRWMISDQGLSLLAWNDDSGLTETKEQALEDAKKQLDKACLFLITPELFKPANIRLISLSGQEIDIQLELKESFYHGSFTYQARWQQNGYINKDCSTSNPNKLIFKVIKEVNKLEARTTFRRENPEIKINAAQLNDL